MPFFAAGTAATGWLVSRVVSMLDSGTEESGFKLHP